jgi:hypothetical protein
LTASALSQGSGHQHIAPLAPSAVLNGRSPLLNWADGSWNHGEGFPAGASEVGGVLSDDNPGLLTLSEITTLRNWAPLTGYSMHQFIGEFRPSNSSETGYSSSFEILVHNDFYQNPLSRPHVVIVLTTAETRGSAVASQDQFNPHVYPGDPSPSRLGLWDWPFPGGPGLVQHFYPSGYDFHVVFAHIVPRTSGRPLVFSVQRLRQLRHAVMLKLNQHAGQTLTYTTCVSGSSFGGLTTQVALLLHPDEFHAGLAYSFSGSLRAVPNDHASYDLITAGLGLGQSGAGYSLRDAIDFSIYDRTAATDYTSLSFVNRVARGEAKRSFLFMVSDEDGVTHGNDWIPPLMQPPTPT